MTGRYRPMQTLVLFLAVSDQGVASQV